MGAVSPRRVYRLKGGWGDSWERASFRGRGAGLVFAGQCVSTGSGGKAFQSKVWGL